MAPSGFKLKPKGDTGARPLSSYGSAPLEGGGGGDSIASKVIGPVTKGIFTALDAGSRPIKAGLAVAEGAALDAYGAATGAAPLRRQVGFMDIIRGKNAGGGDIVADLRIASRVAQQEGQLREKLGRAVTKAEAKALYDKVHEDYKARTGDFSGGFAEQAYRLGTGLAVEVGADPLNYVGVGLVDDAAKAGRLGVKTTSRELGNRVIATATENLTDDALREAGSIAAKIAAKGKGALSKTELNVIGDLGIDGLSGNVRRGLVFGGNGAGVAIPGTERIANVLDTLSTGVRSGTGDVAAAVAKRFPKTSRPSATIRRLAEQALVDPSDTNLNKYITQELGMTARQIAVPLAQEESTALVESARKELGHSRGKWGDILRSIKKNPEAALDGLKEAPETEAGKVIKTLIDKAEKLKADFGQADRFNVEGVKQLSVRERITDELMDMSRKAAAGERDKRTVWSTVQANIDRQVSDVVVGDQAATLAQRIVDLGLADKSTAFQLDVEGVTGSLADNIATLINSNKKLRAAVLQQKEGKVVAKEATKLQEQAAAKQVAGAQKVADKSLGIIDKTAESIGVEVGTTRKYANVLTGFKTQKEKTAEAIANAINDAADKKLTRQTGAKFAALGVDPASAIAAQTAHDEAARDLTKLLSRPTRSERVLKNGSYAALPQQADTGPAALGLAIDRFNETYAALSEARDAIGREFGSLHGAVSIEALQTQRGAEKLVALADTREKYLDDVLKIEKARVKTTVKDVREKVLQDTKDFRTFRDNTLAEEAGAVDSAYRGAGPGASVKTSRNEAADAKKVIEDHLAEFGSHFSYANGERISKIISGQDPFTGDMDEAFVRTVFGVTKRNIVQLTDKSYMSPGFYSFISRTADGTNALGFLSYANELTKIWRGAIFMMPGFSNRNGMGGMLTAFTDKVKLEDFRSAAGFYRKIIPIGEGPESQAINTLARRVKGSGELTAGRLTTEAAAAIGHGVKEDEILQMLAVTSVSVGQGIEANTGFETSRFLVRLGRIQHWMDTANPLSVRAVATGDFGRSRIPTEVQLRLGHYIGLRRQGYEHLDSIRRVQWMHLDYQDLSSMDVAAKGAYPFWVFRTRSVPREAELLLTKGNRARNFIEYANNSQNEEGQNGMPPFISPTTFALGGNTFAGLNGVDAAADTYDLGSKLASAVATRDLGKIGRAVGQSGPISDLGPGLKTPLEILLGRETFRDRGIGGDSGEVRPGSFSLDLVPPIAAIRRAKNSKTYTSGVGNALAQIGIPVPRTYAGNK